MKQPPHPLTPHGVEHRVSRLSVLVASVARLTL